MTWPALVSCLLLGGESSRAQQGASSVRLQGQVLDLAGQPCAGASVSVDGRTVLTDREGRYAMVVAAGKDLLTIRVADRVWYETALTLTEDRSLDIRLTNAETVTVQAQADVFQPDPATQAYTHAEVLDANPGRPGVPLSIPGYPAETASGGIKAPQYFAPGVAGDHGEPIAQYTGIASFLLPNNLTANAHGNGYADPNFLVSGVIGGALVDGGAFNARYGDHAINLAVTYEVRESVQKQLQVTTTGKDVAVGGSWSGSSSWVAAEALLGNGWLKRPEEREQYKVNALRAGIAGRHQLTVFGAGYYGFSRIPGLIPLDVPEPSGTIDPRQSDLTHTALVALVDQWQPRTTHSLVTGAYFRTYSLDLRSNFGDGLIEQSEFRTMAGGTTTYSQGLGSRWVLLAGLEGRRDAPRGLDLHRFDEASQSFHLVASNDLTLITSAPFAAVAGQLVAGVRLYAGVRRDQICFTNVDRLNAQNSFQACPGVTSPKVNVTLGSLTEGALPQIGLSFAKAFHANDPRIGDGTDRGQLIATAREYQITAGKSVKGVEAHLVLGKVASSSEFAKIDPDTGLQDNVGPGLNRFLTVQVRQRTSTRFWQASWSEADARDRSDGTPIPEAPRMIVDALYGVTRLPLGLRGKTEFEYVKAKPLGDGISGVPLREVRFELGRTFGDGRWDVSANGQWMQGFSGQTTETLSPAVGSAATEQRVGVPVASYATLMLQYNFR